MRSYASLFGIVSGARGNSALLNVTLTPGYDRLDYAIHGKAFDGKHKLAVDQLPTWPTWRKSQMQRTMYGQFQMDGFRDADKLDS